MISRIFFNSCKTRGFHGLSNVFKPVAFGPKPSSITRSKSDISILNIQTNLPKDVVLFRYENPKYFFMLNTFAIFQFGFWVYISHFIYTTLKDAPVVNSDTEELPWWRKINLGQANIKNSMASMTLALGNLILFASWLYSLRCVRYVVLRKGGDIVSFVTYGPFNRNRVLDVPLSKVSASESRLAAKTHLPIKIKDRWFYFTLDMRGEFLKPDLFDATAGLARKL